MATVDIETCPSGECQHYTYPPGFGEPGSALLPRPVEVIIHTRADFDDCERLSYLMGRNDTCPEERRAAREYEHERQWVAYHYGGGYLARD